MQPNDIIRVKAFASYLTQQVLNVYWYKCITWTGVEPLQNVVDTFHLNVVNNIKVGQNDGVLNTFILLENQMTPFEYRTKVIAEQGSVVTPAAERLASFIAAAWRLQVATRDTRPGQKRITGLWEAGVSNDFTNYTGPQQTAIQTGLTAWLQDVYPVAVDFAFQPVVCKFSATGQFLGANGITGAQVVRVTSQNTRKAKPTI